MPNPSDEKGGEKSKTNTLPNGSSHLIEGMGSSSSGTWTLHINVLAALMVCLGTVLASLCSC